MTGEPNITAGNWGVSLRVDKSYMVVTPPAEERERLRKQRRSITMRRIAVLEPSYYVPVEECRANAHLFAASKKLLAVCRLVKLWFDERPDEEHPCDDLLAAAITAAEGKA